MIRRYKPYPAYKDSGVEWLGEIPATWEMKRIKHLSHFVTSGSRGWAEHYSDDGALFLRIGNLKPASIDLDLSDVQRVTPPAGAEGKRTLVLRGDLLVSITALIGAVAVVPAGIPPAFVNQHLALIRFSSRGAHPRWVGYCVLSLVGQAQLQADLYGGTKDGLALEDIRSLAVLSPPIAEQHTIAAVLDRETARIDALVAKKERLIGLLQEKRTALITRSVTKGLDPNVLMKDSVVEWLGEIPEHWDVKRLWHLTPADRRIMYGIVLPGPNVDDGVPIVKGGDVAPGRLRLDGLSRTAYEIEAGHVRSRLRSGDLVYAIRGSIGEVAMVPRELEGANLTQDAARIAYTSKTYGPWLLCALRSAPVFAQLEVGALGATIRGINIRDLKRAAIAVPPPSEQRAIADFLDRETAKLDALIGKVQQAIDRLKELRTALISAAVTGKIDVREEAA